MEDVPIKPSSCFSCYAAVLLLAAVGCTPTAGEPTPQTTVVAAPVEAPTPETPAVVEPAGEEPAQDLADREIWDVYMIRGSRVGYGRTTVKHVIRSGQPVVRIEGVNYISVKRFDQETTQEIRFTSYEKSDGRLLDFETEVRQGPVPLKTVGRVVGDELELVIETQGKTSRSTIPWKPQYGGFYATEASLAADPMTPGERRTISALAVGLNQVATVEMKAIGYEEVELLTGRFELLRIDTITQFPNGTALTGATWTDRTGDVLKTDLKAMNIAIFRAPKAVALAKTEAAELDLGLDIAVKLDRPIPNPHRTRQMRYRVRLADGDPAAVFPSGSTQAVKPAGPHEAEITVYAIRGSGNDGNADAAADKPTAAERQPNSVIQSDDPKIVAEANKVARTETDPWKLAVALERYVHEEITVKSFSQAFATAADVARTREGDCSEHAVFLAALARARGLPARIAIGLVYMEGKQAFGYHAWTEVYVIDRWVPIDATLGLGGIGAAHLKLGHASLAGPSPLGGFLPVLEVAGQLTIEQL